MRVSGSRHIYDFVSSESGITLLLLKWKSSFNYFGTTKNLICLELAIIKVKEIKLWSWLNIFFALRYCLTKILIYNEWNLLYNKEQNSRHVGQILAWIRVLLIKGFGQDKPGIRLGWSLLICDWISKVKK